MSGETQKDESGWTVDTSRYDLQQQIDLLQIQIDRRLHDGAKHNKLAREIIIQRMTDNDKAVELLSTVVNKVPSETDLKVGAAKELFMQLFNEREKQGIALTLAANDAVRTALAERKETTAAQAESFAKALEKTEQNLRAEQGKNADIATVDIRALREQEVDLKARLDRLEASKSGGNNQLIQMLAIISSIIAAVAVFYAILKP